MPASEFLADEVIDAIREEGLIAASDEEELITKVRSVLNRELRLYGMALLQKAREEYQVETADLAVVAGASTYDIPSKAAGAAIVRLEWVNGTERAKLYPTTANLNASVGSGAYGTGEFYLQGSKIHLCVAPSTSGTWTVVYARRFNRLVAASACGEVSAIDTGTKQVTLVHPDSGASTVPATFTTARTYDFVKGTPHFDVLDSDAAVTTVASNVLTFTETLPTGLAVGDFVALAGQSPVVNAHLEFQSVLILKAVHSYLSGGGDATRSGLVKERLDKAEADWLTIASPRVDGGPELIINYSAPGWNRGMRFRRTRWGG